jgi:hypothetical protein
MLFFSKNGRRVEYTRLLIVEEEREGARRVGLIYHQKDYFQRRQNMCCGRVSFLIVPRKLPPHQPCPSV